MCITILLNNIYIVLLSYRPTELKWSGLIGMLRPLVDIYLKCSCVFCTTITIKIMYIINDGKNTGIIAIYSA